MIKAKGIFILIVMSFIFCSAYSQDNLNYSKRTLFERKINTYKKVRRFGIGLLIGGSVQTCAATLWAIKTNKDLEKDKRNHISTSVPSFLIVDEEVFLIGAGAGCIIAGGILSLLGTRKINIYRNKLTGLSLNIKFSSGQKGLGFSYKF